MEAPPIQSDFPATSPNMEGSNYINNSFSVQPTGSKFMNATKDYLPDKVKIGGNEFELEELLSKAEFKGKQLMKSIQSNKVGKDFVDFVQNFDVDKVDVKKVMQYHGYFSILVGVMTVLFPSFFYSQSYDPKNFDYMAHEFCRLYGCLSLALGYIVLKCRTVADGRLTKLFCETFGIIYVLQAFSMFVSQFSDPSGAHSFFHFLIATGALGTGLIYTYIRFNKKIKSYDLPGSELADAAPVAQKKNVHHMD